MNKSKVLYVTATALAVIGLLLVITSIVRPTWTAWAVLAVLLSFSSGFAAISLAVRSERRHRWALLKSIRALQDEVAGIAVTYSCHNSAVSQPEGKFGPRDIERYSELAAIYDRIHALESDLSTH